MDASWLAAVAGGGFVAGLFGAMLGLGGGILLVPILVVLFHLPMHTAIATSLIGVVATSVSAGGVYLHRGVANVRLALLMQAVATLGAIGGSLLAAGMDVRALSAVFAGATVYSAVAMARGFDRIQPPAAGLEAGRDRLHLGSSYFDAAARILVAYQVQRLPLSLGFGLLAGMLAGMLGIGGGSVHVPVMTMGMGVPIKVATATSTFVVGVTAVAGATIYYAHGYVSPLVAAGAAVGMVLGARAGAAVASAMNARRLNQVFVVILLVIAAQMLLRALGLGGR